MKHTLLALFLVGTGSLLAQSLAPNNYTRGHLAIPQLRNNSIAPVHAIPISEADPIADQEPNQTQYQLEANVTLGATDVELSAPQYYLGDEITQPSDPIDWNAIHSRLDTYTYHFLVDTKGEKVYAVAGGTATFTWPLLNGREVETICQIAYSSKTRPKRVFWTNAPYKGPTVSLNNSFVKLVGDPKLVTVKTETTTYPNSDLVIETKTLHGIYIDETANTIHVIQGDRATYGDLRGQFVAAYYSSGHFDDLLGLQVIEVSSPEPVMLTGFVGEAVKPDGGGFPTDGLQPYPISITPTDDKGFYYYQHVATTPNNPQHMKVYPLRPTDSANMRLQVWWKEADEFDTLWPFELSSYNCTWSEKPLTQVVAADGGISLPLIVGTTSGYTATIEKCLDSSIGSVTANTTAQSYTVSFQDQKQEGFWTLRLTAGDNIWFVPVHAIANTSTNHFSTIATEWLVGEEIIPRGGDASGLTLEHTPTEVDETLAGYIYEKTSAPLWNPELYREPSTDATADATEALPSAIFPVRALKGASEKHIEVWWQGSYQQEGMPQPITSPVLVQRYAPRWPTATEAPAIVLASGLGSAGISTAQSGKAMKIATAESQLELPLRRFFGDGGTLAFWINRNTATSGNLIRLGDSQSNFTLTFALDAGNLKTEITGWATDATMETKRTLTATTEISTNAWTFVAITLEQSDNPSITLQLNDTVKAVQHLKSSENSDTGFTQTIIDVASQQTPTGTNYPLWPTTDTKQPFSLASGVIGCDDTHAAAANVLLDELSLWRRTLTPNELKDLQYRHPDEKDNGLILAYTFESAGDLDVLGTTNVQRTVTDCVSGNVYYGTHLIAHTPGAPLQGTGIIISDTEPTIYRQPDVTAVGYNPNEEHAFIRTGGGGYTVWAFRCDLNTDDTSAPGVLVSYSLGGKAKMKWLGVQAVSEKYPEFSGKCTAGTILPGPHPFDLMQDPWLKEINWNGSEKDTCPAYRDRKGQVWARCDGILDIHMFYRADPSYDLGSANNNVFEWLPKGHYNDFYGKAVDAWTWEINWPENVPTLKLGQTLTTAVNGLPEVWNAKSLALVYTNATAILFDPTVIQSTGPKDSEGRNAFTTTSEFVRFLGLTPGEDGITYTGGRYTFGKAPASVADRFYIDTSAEIASCVRLRGEMEEKNAGTKMLHLNLLNQQERSELAAMLDDKGKTIAEVWSSLFTTPTDNALFAQEAIEPSLTTTNQTASVVSPSTPYQVEWQTTYKPVDHYALTAKGIGPNQNGYLTLLENDNPDTAIVAEGDPISMHIIKVVPELYTGSLIVREDPTNLLSQQLSVLYTEGFAGDAGNYTFEWKWAEPTATGRVPENYENGYMLHAKADGLTRFLIGAQGDTLENMVNRYYVMRYRPKAGSTELDALKAAIKARDKDTADLSDNDPRLWSGWCGPTLAEGWIQRVLNNVTPFTQRMTDLYTNPTETAVSMIQQAGAPYTGDVALNQDNLTNVGLIQLYATLLNKAESMSINQTTGSGAVNDQLLLAATRLADLYCVLGDEAYVDALNPTIGFGSEFARVDDANIGIDYGALSTGLFCFDNQVQSLLDEELALLRGRAAEDAPSKQTGPWYNRLLWNFTKGITAGEVAYAVNYNITGSTTGILDEETAAKLYPQGHGDAYGHYLSAVKAYYRLLRNPNFSWGTPGMGEMLMADAVVNNDYYEENRFSELAGALAKTAAAIMERTAQKAWRDNGGLPGAGYLDEDASRAFGYGEWGTRGALGAFYGWAVGNSLLPAGPTQDHLWQFRAIRQEDALMPPTIVAELPQDCSTSATFKPDGDTGETLLQPFTFELQIEVTEVQPALTGENTAPPLLFLGSQSESSAADGLTIFRDANGLLTATHGKGLTTLGTLPPNERCLLAIRRSVTLLDANLKTYDQQLTVTLLNANGMPYWETVLPETASEKQPLFEFNGKLLLGCGIEGTFHEIRWWQGIARSNEALVAARQKLISESTALKFAVHTYADAATDTLRDTVSSNACQVIGGTWEKIASNGLATDFRDDGLLRINRSTADDLNDLPQQLKSITDSLDRLDVGVSPLGLVHNAMPFDLSPIGLEDGTQTHFEQILSRAETAVANAATILDHVQQLGNRLRQIQEAQTAYEEQLESQEASLTADLIGYYGTPYSGDIGAGKFYTQDYAGPDLYHYMYMDLTAYGLTEVPSSSNAKVTRAYQIAEEDYRYVGDYGKNSSLQVEKKGTLSLSYDLTADGFIAKPEDLTGSRRTTGAIQQAYADVLTAYVAYDNLLKLATQQEKLMEDIITEMQAVYRSSVQFYQFKAICETVLNTIQAGNAIGAAVTNALGVTYEITNTFANASAESASTWVVAGLAAGTNASETIAKFVAAGVVIPSEITSKVANAEFATANAIVKAVDQFIRAETALFGNEVNLRASLFNYRSALRTQLGTYVGTINSLHSAAALLQAKIQQMTQTIYEAEGIQSVRNRVRRQAADGIARMRYNDMFFRQLRNEALARYEKAFALAQRYTYLAAQAYDYETCQLTAGLAGDDFRGEIVAARSLGVLTADRKPMLAGSYGDPGLSDILARLKADYLVLKPRLGINNPKQEMTWFSLRRELLRLGSDSEGDRAWQAALERYTVKDLRAHAEFMRYCRPLTSSTGTTLAEPGLVIPFETSIDFARNFFGKDLQGGDSAFSPTDFATRIAGAGVALEGYNVPASGVVGTPPLAATPQVYLVPAGDDYFRTPGDADTILRYSVVDQTVPLPYNVGQSQLDDPDWQPLYDGNTGGVDLGARLRKYGSFRASVGTDTAETGSTRLIGRSVWNSRWLLIIPFGSMHTDRDAAMRAFIYGTTAYPGVNDIRLGLRTYSHEGN